MAASRAAAVCIRRMRGTDLARVIAMDRAAVVDNHLLVPMMLAPSVDLRLARRHWAGFRRWRNSVIFVAVDGLRPVGMLGAEVRDARNPRTPVRRWVYLHSMYVDPCARGRGIARRLIRRALAWARGKGANAATLETAVNNDAAQALYAGFGFVTQEVMMARRLKQLP